MDHPPPPCIPHVVILPFPHQGHVAPALYLAIQLASVECIVTFVNTERNHEKFFASNPAFASAHKKTANIDLRFVSIPDGLPPDPENPPCPCDTQNSGRASVPNRLPGTSPPLGALIESFSKQGPDLERLIDDLRSAGTRVTCLIADEFMAWPGEVAQNLKIPWVVFSTASATWMCVKYFALNNLALNAEPVGNAIIPGLPLSGAHLSSLPPAPENVKRRMQEDTKAMENATCFLANSCNELEKAAFAAAPVKAPILSIGPLILGAASEFDELHGGLLKPDEDALPWLDTQQADSVVYISFGSRSSMSSTQLAELARGIEASETPFLWVERSVEQLPAGFMERTRGLGRVVKWAPQRQVLRHRSVGAFVTHCGWNSIMEAMARGVPMVCWPQAADQATNSILVEQQWKVGRRLSARRSYGDEAGEGRPLVEGRQVSRVLKEVMEEKELRLHVRLLSERAKVAMAPGGSSDLNLQCFLRHLQSWTSSM